MTPKQRRFVEEYLVDLNATQAAKRAGYAEGSAWRVMRNPEVAAGIEKAQAARAERTRVTADKVVEELAKVTITELRNLNARLSEVEATQRELVRVATQGKAGLRMLLWFGGLLTAAATALAAFWNDLAGG